MKNFEISVKVQKSLREREVVFQSSKFMGIGWQELSVGKPDTPMKRIRPLSAMHLQDKATLQVNN